jgi:hypothetical protein
MTKGKDIKSMLGNKSPGMLRQGVPKINILQEATAMIPDPAEEVVNKPDEQSQSIKEIDKPEEKELSKESISSIDAKKRIVKEQSKTDRINRSQNSKKPRVFSEKDVQAVLAVNKRQTERYSFEIYTDQKADIEQICRLYEQATGKKLSASRLIREVLDTFLPDALKTFEAPIKKIDKE